MLVYSIKISNKIYQLAKLQLQIYFDKLQLLNLLFAFNVKLTVVTILHG